LKNRIYSFLKENSTVASNRIVKNKDNTWLNPGVNISARYLNDGNINLFNKFPFKNAISKPTFMKYLIKSGQFKKPHR
jgi:hypothetical protein